MFFYVQMNRMNFFKLIDEIKNNFLKIMMSKKPEKNWPVRYSINLILTKYQKTPRYLVPGSKLVLFEKLYLVLPPAATFLGLKWGFWAGIWEKPQKFFFEFISKISWRPTIAYGTPDGSNFFYFFWALRLGYCVHKCIYFFNF